ncbi:MAG: tRNA guanosine(34) transglycosylase Tgt [Sphaerochaetaceae bacterium]|jgi:queuine tRNA-ribosyltransferase
MKNIFEVTYQDKNSAARNGLLTLGHGVVKTPTFMPVGTNATVKALHHETVSNIGYNLILANTYHLYLRPTMEVLETYGGLHNFSNWNKNILTDSGGFQIFSLSKFRKIEEEGVMFQSHIDGSRHKLTPEKVVDIQKIIGSDILMVLDVCTAPDISWHKAKEAMDITHLWAKRSKEHWENQEDFKGKLFGIVQGNFYKDLRKVSAEVISELDFPGIAIGGLSVGESSETFSEYLNYTTGFLPKDKVRYVMGIGSPDYILDAIGNGIDIFDCVLATRAGRNGSVFTDDGLIQMKKAVHTFDQGPIVEGCNCRACKDYSRGYLRHMFKANEMLGGMLATEHNLTYLYDLVEKARLAISEDRFESFKNSYLKRYYGL